MWNHLVFRHFGTDAEKVFGPYTVENAVPWYTIMFVIACILTVAFIWIIRGKLSENDPKPGQMTLEAGYLYLAGMAESVIGPHGMKYFPVVATFACLVLVSNLMGQFPLFMSPTASVNVTFALGISSFVYYNYAGISENGLIAHLKHLAGPKLPWFMFIVTVLIFGIELISNLIRPLTLGVRLFANMYSDEQVFVEITNLYPPFTAFPGAARADRPRHIRRVRADARIYAALDDLPRRGDPCAARSRGRTPPGRHARPKSLAGNGIACQ